MALTSCENEAMNEGIQENDTYTMTFVAGAPESRTSVSVDGNVAKFAWDAEESFTVVENTTALALAKNVEFNKNGELAEITATFDAVEAEEYSYVAVYPKDAWATSNNDAFNKAKLIFPTKQTMTTNSYDPDADLLVSKVLTTTSQPTEAQMLEFRRLVAIGEMNIKGLQTDGAEKILSVDFAANDAILTGRAYVDLATNTVLEYGYTGQAFKNVNISCAMEVAEANTVYFTCMPATLKSGEAYTITVTTDKAIYTKKGTIGANALEFTEGNVTGFTANMATATREVLESLEGKWVIVTKRSSGNFFYVTPDLGTAGTKRFQAVDTNSADIASVDATIENYHWTIAKYGDNYSIQAPAGTYVSWTSGNSADLADTAKEIVISKVEGKEYYNISLKDEATRVLALNESYNYCAFYTGTQIRDMYLIPAVVDKREKQELSFSYDSITVNYGESITEPNLVGAQTKVTWTSSDNTIASVDGDGFVDLEGGLGTVTITATAEADDYYREGSASYTITVVDPAAEPEELETLDNSQYYVFQKATSIKGGKWYAIVANDTKAATALTENYGYLAATNAMALANGISLPTSCAFGFLTTNGGYTIQQYDGKYVYQTGTYNSFNVSTSCPTDGSQIWTVSIVDGIATIINTSVSKTICYSSYGTYASYAEPETLPTLYELVEVDATPRILKVSASELSFAAEAASGTITVTTAGTANLDASADKTWVTPIVSGNNVNVSVEANTGEEREAIVTISYGDASQTVTIKQAAPEGKTEKKYTWTLANGDLSKNAGTVSKGTPAISWTQSAATYIGFDNNNGRGFQIGSGSNPTKSFSLKTSGISGTIKTITINASMASSGTAKFNISVGGTKYLTNKSVTTKAADYTATVNNSGEIEISVTNTAKAFYIKSITIVYEE